MFADEYLQETSLIIDRIDINSINKMIDILIETKKNNGRIFFLGNGGSASTSSHAVNDFRKICGFECYSPVDNIPELTARMNDNDLSSMYVGWLETSNLYKYDVLYFNSVGGGNVAKGISANLVYAAEYSKKIGCKILAVCGRTGGSLKAIADACVLIPTINENHITPHVEEFCAIILHLLVSHPLLKENQTKWESIK